MNRLFVNRTLNLKQIKAIGFDMDHTLVRYFTDAFEELAFWFLKQRLVEHDQYPKIILDFEFQYDRTIRGLVIDQKTGTLLKLDRFNQIHTSFQGTRQVPFKEQRKRYSDRMVDLADVRYLSIDTTFSMSVASLYTQLVDLKLSGSEILPEFDDMAKTLVKQLDQAHGDGSLKAVVAKDLHKYIKKEPEVAQGLERMKKHGKFLFIITNSEYEYARTLLEYAIDPFLTEHNSWKELFNLVIVGAQKPRFFHDALRLMQVDLETGFLKNHFGAMIPGVFQGGHARQFERDFGFRPHEILYMGDHIYGDILRLKKDRGWRTGLILEELDQEIADLNSARESDEQILPLMDEKEILERRIQILESEQIERGIHTHKKEINRLFGEMTIIDEKLKVLLQKSGSFSNPYWGPIMRSGNMESYYAHQVIRYADLYMGQLSAFTDMSPRTYFRAKRRVLPHESLE